MLVPKLEMPKRQASIRVITDRRGYRYAQLVYPTGQTKSLGAFNPTNNAPLLDHVLTLVERQG